MDAGKLALDATLADAAPGVAAKYPTVADRTIEQLLSMTGGIPDYTEVPDGVIAGVAADPSRVWTADEMIASGLTQPLTAVGANVYSSTGYLLLQEVAEEIAGTPLAQLIADGVTGPLGLTHTVLPPDTDTTLPGAGGARLRRRGLRGADGGARRHRRRGHGQHRLERLVHPGLGRHHLDA